MSVIIPVPGKGPKNTECARYDSCLDYAAKRDWVAFNCKGCPHQDQDSTKKEATMEKKENTGLCTCGKPTISPNSPLCPWCMSERSHKPMTTKKETKPKRPRGRPRKDRPPESPVEATKTNKTAHSMPKPKKKAAVKPEADLAINFGKYGSVLERVEELAAEEMRPVDMQVIYMLRRALDAPTP